MPNPSRSVVGALVLALLAPAVSSQCAPVWAQQQALAGIHGTVRAAASWDPDGPGPRGPVVVLGGFFDVAGTELANGIAAYDFATGTWSTFGAGLGSVNALLVLPTGELVAGGSSVHRWNGSTWVQLGAGFDSEVLALARRPNGDLVAGGSFTYVGTQVFGGIARWNGTAWVPMGSGMNQAVQAVAALPNGDVVAGGWFTYVAGQLIERIARWNGSAWSALGAGIGGEVHALLALANGDLVAGGEFVSAGGAPADNVARWNGASWSALGTGITGGYPPRVHALHQLANGDLLVGGNFFSAGGAGASCIARWDGTSWSALDGGITSPLAYVTLLYTRSPPRAAAWSRVGSSGAREVPRSRTSAPSTAPPGRPSARVQRRPCARSR
ncbi:MAG: hypothetical protein U1E73_07240 [Planctomycetota bacterium]